MVNGVGVVSDGGNKGSVWWKDVCSLEGLSESFRKIVRNGENTYFWSDLWVEHGSLNVRFPRLLTLQSIKRPRLKI